MRKLLWFIAGGATFMMMYAVGQHNAIKNGDVIEETDEYKITRMKYADGEYSNMCYYEAKEKVEESE